MNRLLTLHRLIALATALLGATLLGCNDSASNAGARYGGQAAAVPVMTAPATLTDLRETLTSVGTGPGAQKRLGLCRGLGPRHRGCD
jgi:hypothetical protein